MTTDDEDRGQPTPLLRVPARVLARLAAACGAVHDPAALDRRLAQSEPPTADSTDPIERLEWLARAGHALGLRTPLSSPRVEAAAKIELDGGLPLLTSSAGRAESAAWFFLSARKGRKVRVVRFDEGAASEGREEWVPISRLAQHLGAKSSDELPWLFADPSTPFERAVSSASSGTHLSPFSRLLRILRPERGDVLAILAFSVTVGILMLATPIAVQAIVNSVALGGVLQPLVVVAFLLLLALGFAATLTAIQTWVVELIQRRLFVRTVADLAARLPRVRLEAYDGVDGEVLVNRFFDIITIQKVVAKFLMDTLGIVLAILVGATVLAFYHPLLLAFDLILLAIIALVVFGPLRRGERTSVAESSSKYAVEGWLEEIARNPYAFKTTGAQQWIFERADALTRSWVDHRSAHFRTLFSQVSAALALQVIASTALLGIGGWLVIQGSLTLGQLVAAELIVTAVVASVAKMGKHLEDWYDLMAAVTKVGHLLDLPVEAHGGEHPHARSSAKGAALQLDDLSWQDARGNTIFQDISLDAEPGARVAITGPSGAGKSTLLELLWRLREPAAGSIRLDGRDIRDLSTEALRREVALVSPLEVVQGTVRANVKLQRPFVSNDGVRDALERVGLLDAVASLPDGMNTPLRPGRNPLSDGQVRRLILARAIAGAPSLLVLDDLLDCLPEQGRAALLDQLFDPAAGWTLVIVSDLPEVLDRCDHVIRLPGAHGSPASIDRSTHAGTRG